MRARRADENSLVVATIGLGIILMSAGMLLWGPYSLPYPQASAPVSWRLGSLAIDQKSVAVWISAVAAVAALQFFLRHTRLGIAMRAAAADPTTASIVGVPVRAIAAFSFGLSGALAGLAGVLIASLYYASFEMGAAGLKSLCAAVIGGFGNLPGAVVGGLLLGLFEAYATVHLSAQFTDTLIYGLLIVFLLVRPQGLLGTAQRKI
jgi:branched-subunit amino acid ABC-type transport system permease component